jgi:hypothetical protein
MYTSIPVCFLVLGAAFCAPERVQSEDSQDSHEAHYAHEPYNPNDPHAVHEAPDAIELEKRSPHYDFGLGKRAYSYVSEYKRLPVYNFGLGKRYESYYILFLFIKKQTIITHL